MSKKVERNAEIVRRIDEGQSLRSVAAIYGVTPNAIKTVYVRDKLREEKAAYTGDEIVKMPISVRTKNCLINAGMKDIKDAATLTEAELLMTPNFGKVSLSEVKLELSKRGLFLREATT